MAATRLETGNTNLAMVQAGFTTDVDRSGLVSVPRLALAFPIALNLRKALSIHSTDNIAFFDDFFGSCSSTKWAGLHLVQQ